VRFSKIVKQILEAIGDVPPPPPAIIQKAEDRTLTYDDIKKFIIDHEGYRNKVYSDSIGIPTIGIGFNLLRPDAKIVLNKLGLSYNDVLSGKTILTDDQVLEIFKVSLKIAYADVKNYIPNFDSLPKNVKLGLIDMSFNLGYNRLNKFVKTKALILSKDYKNAADEILKSKWASQVGDRAKNIAKLFSSV
jgi:lysozyme